MLPKCLGRLATAIPPFAKFFYGSCFAWTVGRIIPQWSLQTSTWSILRLPFYSSLLLPLNSLHLCTSSPLYPARESAVHRKRCNSTRPMVDLVCRTHSYAIWWPETSCKYIFILFISYLSYRQVSLRASVKYIQVNVIRLLMSETRWK